MRIDIWIKDEVVRAVRNAKEFEELNETQKSIIEESTYHFARKGLNIPKVEMLPRSKVEVQVPENCFSGCFDDKTKKLVSDKTKELLEK